MVDALEHTTEQHEDRCVDTKPPASLREAPLLCGLFLATVLAACLWTDLDYLFQNPYPYGVDGYYYVAQVDHLATHGQLFRPAPPLTFWAMRALAFTVPTAQEAVKFASLIFLFLTALLAFWTVYAMTRFPLAAVLAFALLYKGFLRVELLVDFIKQSFGDLWVLALLLLLVLWIRHPKKRYLAWMALCLACAGLTHQLALILCALVLAAYVALRILERFASRRAFLLFGLGTVTLVWTATAVAPRLASHLPGHLPVLIPQFFSSSPHLNFGQTGDSREIPLIVLLLLAVIGSWIYGAWLDHRRADASSSALLFCTVGAVLTPLVALAYSPFLIPSSVNPVGLAPRLIATLSIPAAILVPVALSLLPASRRVKALAAVAGTLILVAAPPFWERFPGPPPDGGRLHNAMLETKDLVPEDAVIITDARTGNMVNALWDRPRVIATRFDPPPIEGHYYRLIRLDDQLLPVLAGFAYNQARHPVPTMIAGPWFLLDEGLYHDFRAYIKTDHPDLESLLDGTETR